MLAVQKSKEFLGGMVELPPQAALAIKLFLDTLLSEVDVSDHEYNDAVSYLAGIDPILAMWLRIDRVRDGTAISELNKLALTPGVPSAVSSALSEVSDPKKLEESIVELARLHGRKTVKNIRSHLKNELETMSESDATIDNLLKSLKDLMRAENQAHPPRENDMV